MWTPCDGSAISPTLAASVTAMRAVNRPRRLGALAAQESPIQVRGNRDQRNFGVGERREGSIVRSSRREWCWRRRVGNLPAVGMAGGVGGLARSDGSEIPVILAAEECTSTNSLYINWMEIVFKNKRIKIASMRCVIALATAALAQGAIQRSPAACSPRPCVYTLTCANRTCSTSESAELQTVFNEAFLGDTILLQSGRAWTGNYIVTARAGASGFLTVQPTANAMLPPQGSRITPSHLGNMATLKSRNPTSVLKFPSAANPPRNIRVIGLELTFDPGVSTAQGNPDIVRIDEVTAANVAQLPDFIEFERCYLHGQINGEARNAILANGKNFTLRDSYISEIKADGVENHAIVSWNTPGPMTLMNNYLEAAAISILFGGAIPSIGSAALPINVDIRYNFFTKPLKWYSRHADYIGVPLMNKNMLEWKIGGGTARWNVFDQNFHGPNNDQAGQALAVNIRLPTPADHPWAVTRDVVFENNVIRKSVGTWSILGTDGPPRAQGFTRMVTIRNNLFHDIGCAWDYQNCANTGVTFGRLIAGGTDIKVENNTFHTLDSQATAATGKAMEFDGTDTPSTVNLTYRNNLLPGGLYGWKADGTGIGAPTVNAKTAGRVVITNNTMTGADSSSWNGCVSGGGNTRTCGGNLFPSAAQWDANYQKWLDPAARNFGLRSTPPNQSPYRRSGSDGKPLGADMALLPQIRNLRISPGPNHTVFSWDLTQPIAGIDCAMEISTNRNLVSKLGAWTVVDDVDPVIFKAADRASRAGNIADGLSRTFVAGKDAVESGRDRKLAAGTLYYFRLMCGGDSQQGSFTTTAASGTRKVPVKVGPLAGTGVASVIVDYGEKETGAPQTLVSSTAQQPCTSSGGCTVLLSGVSHRPQYVRVRQLNADGQQVAVGAVTVIP